MRKRNPYYFATWALINTASLFRGRGVELQVYFGIAVTVPTMMKKLNTKYTIFVIIERTIVTLLEEMFGIAIFDNSQMITLYKNQRNGKSSDVTLATARMFTKTRIPLF